MERSLDQSLLGPSKLTQAEQVGITSAFETAVRAAWPDGGAPPWRLRFVDGRRLGPNALALPGGSILLTDQLVRLADRSGRDARDMVAGVLGHELRHLARRHGMRMGAQTLLVGAIVSTVLGDHNALIAGVPLVLIQSGYSRDMEREADADSLRLMQAAGMSPTVMARFFEEMAAWRATAQGASPPMAIAFGSHPADAERIAYFRNAGN